MISFVGFLLSILFETIALYLATKFLDFYEPNFLNSFYVAAASQTAGFIIKSIFHSLIGSLLVLGATIGIFLYLIPLLFEEDTTRAFLAWVVTKVMEFLISVVLTFVGLGIIFSAFF